MVAAFEGWNDAGEAASTAVRYLARACGAREFASIDPEEFYDFTAARPRVRLDEGLTRHIEWPANSFAAASLASLGGTERDAVFLAGVEPSLRWRSFTGLVLDVCQELRVEFVLTLGALWADVPHTRPVRVTGTATDPELVRRLGLTRSRYEGPTGIVGVLHDRLRQAGVTSASLWASSPHYLGQTPSPKAALALVTRTASLLEVSVSSTDLDIAAAAYERQVNEAVAEDEDANAYVRALEAAYDKIEEAERAGADGGAEAGAGAGPEAGAGAGAGPLRFEGGDALAAEIEKFLRQQRRG